MSLVKEMAMPVLIIGIFICCCASQDSQQDIDESQDALMKALNARYGKRPSGHSFVRFGKRVDNKGHSYMYFGKRSVPADSNVADLLQYLQRSQEPSWKRGHSIMRFGKRSDRHNFIRFGKRDTANITPDNENDVEEDKRDRHSMMYFGKRGGHSMLYFGKRIPYSDEDYDKRGGQGHSMMYFGKRSPLTDYDYEKRGQNGHSMMYFGKRSPLMDEDYEKRAGQGGHSMMYFGKRSPLMDEDYEKRGGQSGHSMMYFGKRSPFVDDNTDKKGHSMMYFGKRSSDGDSYKKSGHSMMYFGKREPYIYDNMDRSSDDGGDLEADKRGPHSMIHFGKRYDDEEEADKKENASDKRAHSMIHFGKRSEDTDDSLRNFTNVDEKRAGHGMIHFGKRDEDPYSIAHDEWNQDMGPFDLNNRHYSNFFKSDESGNPEKRDNKKSHMMIHFGKRSVESNRMSNGENLISQKDSGKPKLQSAYGGQNSSGENSAKKIRTKREAEPSDVPLLSLSSFMPGYDNMEPSEDNYSDYGYEFPFGPNSVIPVRNVRSSVSPEKSKNVFLRFGKR